MSRKAIAATALAVCLAIVFAAISAADRTRSRGGRGAGGAGSRAGGVENIADTFDPRLRQIMATAELEFVGDQGVLQGIDGTIGDSIEQKAVNLIQVSRTQSPEQAQATLRMVLDLGLENAGNERARRILASAYGELATYHADSPDRQAYLIMQAAANTGDGEMRQELESRAQELGVRDEIVEIAQRPSTPGYGTLDFGDDDSCDGATAVGAPSVTPMDIANPAGGFQDRNFLAIVVPSGLGLALEIETTSAACGSEASCSNVAYDTDLALWQMCEAGFEDMLLERDMTGDSGLGWLSKVQTDCLLPDTYFLEVSGQFGAAPKDFNVEVRVVGTCEVPVPDAYESDNSLEEAVPIGHPNSIPDHATGWRGREKKEIQDHSIFPRNENDNLLIDLSRTELMQLVAQKQVLSMVEGLPDVPSGPAEDSQAFLLYQNDPHGGVCNKVPLSLGNYCKSDCDAGGTPAVPSLPTTACIPLSQLVFSGESVPRFGTENPLLFNDDSNPAAGNLGSKLAPRAGGAVAEMCVPRTQPGGPALVQSTPFVFRTRGWRPPFAGSVSSLSYNYQAKSQNQGPCDSYEAEPNNSFADATPTPDASVYLLSGVWEGSETYPANDVDVWGPFDIEGPEEYSIEVYPQIINPFGDAELQLWAGPTDTGDYVMVAADNDANKPNARINQILQPADDFLGNTTADAGYYIVVSTDPTQPVPNWWYAMRVLTPRVDATDIEDNGFDPQVVEYRGNTIIEGVIDPRVPSGSLPANTCDIDRFEYRLNEPSFMTYATFGFTDTVLLLDQKDGIFDLNIHTQGISGEFPTAVGPHDACSGMVATHDNFQGQVVVTQDPTTGTGCGASPTDCCCPIQNTAAVAGKIAFCDRGTCGFAVKSVNVQNSGATGMLLGYIAPGTPGGMGGVPSIPITIPCITTDVNAGTNIKTGAGAEPVRITLDDRHRLACDDDGNPQPGNPYLSIISGCLPAGDYVLSVRGWSGSNGPYVFQMKGVPGCVPTAPPTINAGNSGSFCPPTNSFERVCAYPAP